MGSTLIATEYWCDGTKWVPFTGAPVAPPAVAPKIQLSRLWAKSIAPPVQSLGAGSVAPGATSYPVPTSGVVFVAPGGDDGAAGTFDAPLATFERAFAVVQAGGTVVARAGVYHEGKVGTSAVYAGIPCTKAGVTVQSFPGEAVWLDGSRVVTGWVADGGRWRVPWTVTFDRSPTFTFGAAEDTRPGWMFVDPTYYPCAAWPDQVFVDGKPLTQVNTLARVTDDAWPLNPGTVGKFFVDQANDTAWINVDPTGKTVRMSDLQTTISAGATDVTFRGIGFRRFATSNPHFGCTKAYRDRVRYENIWIEDCSNTGASFQTGTSMIIDRMTVQRCGGLGLHVNNANGIDINRFKGVFNGTGQFNYAPVAGAIKATRLRGFTLRNSELNDNYSKGLWLDETVTFASLLSVDVLRNGQRGIVCELGGGTYIIADCRVCGNGAEGLVVFNVDGLRAWCNTVAGNGGGMNVHTKALFTNIRQFSILADDRAPMSAATSSGVTDSRYGYPHPDNVTWTMTQSQIKNCVIASEQPTNNQVLLGIEDYKKNTGAAKGWQTYGLDWDGNTYARPSTTAPSWLWILANAGSANVSVVTSVAQMRTLTGQEGTSRLVEGDALDDDWRLRNQAAADAAAKPLPSDIAALIGRSAGVQRAGSFR